MKNFIILAITLLTVVCCSKQSPTSTAQNPEPENTTLSVSIDSIRIYGSGNDNADVTYSLNFNSNKGKVCHVTEVVLAYPYFLGGTATIKDDNPPTTVVSGQLATGKFGGLFVSHGTYTLTVSSYWDGWSGVKTATKSK